MSFILVPSPCGILDVSLTGRLLTMDGSFFFAAGFYPAVKIGGRYYAIPSTDKRKIDLNVIGRPIVNMLCKMSCEATNCQKQANSEMKCPNLLRAGSTWTSPS
jgi:hypothetical protein